MTSRNGEEGIDSFPHSITIASNYNLVFRSFFFGKKKSIGIILPHGYRPKDKHMQWIKYHVLHANVETQNASDAEEKVI